ncbi:MAG: Npt1/Npt2 family nucleotide transporter, partial [Myxococcota bacterium]
AAIAAIGGVLVVRIAKTAENGTDYSLMNTVKQALFLPTERAVKYKAKAAIDTFFVRTGDIISAMVVALGLHVFMFKAAEDGGISRFAALNVVLVALWIGISVLIARENAKLTADDEEPAEQG